VCSAMELFRVFLVGDDQCWIEGCFSWAFGRAVFWLARRGGVIPFDFYGRVGWLRGGAFFGFFQRRTILGALFFLFLLTLFVVADVRTASTRVGSDGQP